MKQFLLFLFVLCLLPETFSQTLSPEVISAAGNSFVNGQGELSWTVGEPATATFTNSGILTQGFHQDNLTITAMDETFSANRIIIFPNPTADIIHIQFATINPTNSIELYSADGKRIMSRKINSEIHSEIDMTLQTSGTYILKITGTTTQSYQIIKLK